jgi:hypothetical protein
MKKQNLQNGIFILVISGVFYHTFTLPMKPKIGRGIASIGSPTSSFNYCDNASVNRSSGSVCHGEDWWLPSSVEKNSPFGTVYTYGLPVEDPLKQLNMLRLISGVEGNNKFGNLFPSLVYGYDGTDSGGDDLNAAKDYWKTIWYKLTEWHCSYQSDPRAFRKDDSQFVWGQDGALPYNASLEGIVGYPYGKIEDDDSGEVDNNNLDTNFMRTCKQLESFYTVSPIVSESYGRWLFDNDFIKRHAIHGWYTETGDLLADDSESEKQLLTAYQAFHLRQDEKFKEEYPEETDDETRPEDPIRPNTAVTGDLRDNNTLDLFNKYTSDDHWERVRQVFSSYKTLLDETTKPEKVVKGMNPLYNFWLIWLNGEAGFWSNYLAEDFVCLAGDNTRYCDINNNLDWHEVANKHHQVASESGIDSKYFMININAGGTVYKPIVDLVYKHGYSLGTHGAFSVFGYQFLQHLTYLTYNDSLKAFVSDYNAMKPPMVHIDLESMFKEYSRAWGDYRLFRLAALSAVGYRMNSFVTNSNGIVSEGKADCGEDKACKNFNENYGDLNYSGAVKMHTWLKKIAGREKEQSVDGWCAPMHMGVELSYLSEGKEYGGDILEDPVRDFPTLSTTEAIGSGSASLASAVRRFQASMFEFDTNGGNDRDSDGYNDLRKSRINNLYDFGDGIYVTRRGASAYRDYSVNSPLKTFVGHHCKMTTQGVPGIKLDPSWTGYKDCLLVFSLPGDTTTAYHKCMRGDAEAEEGERDQAWQSGNWLLSQEGISGRVLSKNSPLAFDRDSYPYEGRGTDENNRILEFQYDRELFQKKPDVIVKIVLRPREDSRGNGKIRVSFQQGGQSRSIDKEFIEEDFDERTKKISTLTLKFNKFNNDAAKVRIENRGDNHFDYLMVRVIPDFEGIDQPEVIKDEYRPEIR